MNDSSKIHDIKLSDEEKIINAWIDVKLCSVTLNERNKNLSAIKDKKSVSKENLSSMLFYDELHYGNYE